MEKYDVVVIGGGPAGVQAAISARNSYPNKTIALIRKEKIALIPCGIPYILHTLNSVDEDILPDLPLKNNDIELIIGEVINRDKKILNMSDGNQIGFEKLVLALGSIPIFPKIAGVEKKGIYFVKKQYDYLQNLREATKKAKDIAIVGGGYIGVEMADELLKAGKNITLLEMMPNLLPASMDIEFGDMIQEEIERRGGRILTNSKVREFTGDQVIDGLKLENGDHIKADLVIMSVGYKQNTSLAEKFGIQVNPDYGIIVDEYLRTSEKDIFSAGDCATHRSCNTGDYSRVMLASTAMAQGRLAGSNLYEIKILKAFPGTLGSFATKVGKVAIGVSGLTEEQAKKLGVNYVVGTTEAPDRHPGKIPGMSKIYMKLIFARYSHVLIGAQVKGGDSVGELINMFSVMIQKKMTDMEIDTLQIGTHPLLTSSPLAYPVINATVNAILKWFNGDQHRYDLKKLAS